MNHSVTRRRIGILAGVAISGALALVVQGVLMPGVMPDAGEYFLTKLARANIGFLSVLLAMMFAALSSFYTRAHPIAVGLAMITVFPIIVFYEAFKFRGSHNLLPFELAMVAAWSLPFMIAAFAGRTLGRMRGQPDYWAGRPFVDAQREDRVPQA